MSKKFIPNRGSDFVQMAQRFARRIAEDPAAFGVSQADLDRLNDAVKGYIRAFMASQGGDSRCRRTTREKGQARAQAEQEIRRLARIIRASPDVDGRDKLELGIRPRPEGLKSQPCPEHPPRLRFVRALHEGSNATPMHELEFSDWQSFKKARPVGAARLELFVDLVGPDEPIPGWPGANLGGRPWYLRSYTKNPIVVIPPMPRVPMRVVYWGRWADSTGNVGPFSETAVAWIEGGVEGQLPGGRAMVMGGVVNAVPRPAPLLEDATAAGPAGREERYSVAVLEVRSQSLRPKSFGTPSAVVMVSLPGPADHPARQLEGPGEKEEAKEAA